MSENILPEVAQMPTTDVVENAVQSETAVMAEQQLAEAVEAVEIEQKAEIVAEEAAIEEQQLEQAESGEKQAEVGIVPEEKEEAVNLGDKSIAELSDLFNGIRSAADSMLRSKEAEDIKTAFYNLLAKLKEEVSESIANPFEAVEQNFKAMYEDYKKERAEYTKQQESQKEQNLVAKKAIIEELKALVEGQDDVIARFPAFRELQNRWREAGPVPAVAFKDINDSYQHNVEKFYNMVKISRDLRDLDYKKNLEVKTTFCEAAEKLAESENVVNAFHELQKLHEQWKEYGPVAKEFRDDIWNRFKAATAVVNKRYQAHFDVVKDQQKENLEKKTALCVRVEEISAAEVGSASEWNKLSKEIEDIQAQWRKIGFATKKDNQKIYDRFRAACDAFFARKREHYSAVKGDMNANFDKKIALIEQAEALKSSTDWKKTTDQLIALQNQWKEIGAVPRKKSEQLWKRFRAACDEFFAARDAQAPAEGNIVANLKAKRALIEEIKACEATDIDTMREFAERWQSIGFVPFREKEKINASYKQAMQSKFPDFSAREAGRGANRNAARSPKDILVAQYHALQQDITTYENNIGFFAASKNSAPLIKQMQDKIDQAKVELAELEAKIRKAQEEA